MIITRTSPLSGNTTSMELPVTSGQMERFKYRRQNGERIQDIFPNLTPAQREFILTGITAEEWDETFKDE